MKILTLQAGPCPARERASKVALARLAVKAHALLEKHRQYRRARQTRMQLLAMSDLQLKDIGLDRNDVLRAPGGTIPQPIHTRESEAGYPAGLRHITLAHKGRRGMRPCNEQDCRELPEAA